jgi:hypothetical protein
LGLLFLRRSRRERHSTYSTRSRTAQGFKSYFFPTRGQPVRRIKRRKVSGATAAGPRSSVPRRASRPGRATGRGEQIVGPKVPRRFGPVVSARA